MKSSELLRLLKKNGWYEVRQTGSHKVLKHDSNPLTIIYPDHGSKEVGKGLEKKIRKQAGL